MDGSHRQLASAQADACGSIRDCHFNTCASQSYAGKYVPAIAHYIHTLNPSRDFKIHLEGIAIGDAYSDPESVGGFLCLNLSLAETNSFELNNV